MVKHRFHRPKVLITILALVLLVSLLLAACGPKTTTSTTTSTSSTTSTTTTSTSTTTTTATTSAQKVLKIGSVIPLQGAKGLQTKKWYDLFAKLINNSGGWKIGNDTYQVQMIIYDSQGDVTKAKDSLTRLVLQDGCKFILGGWSVTGSADVDCTVTEPNKVIVISEDLTNQGVVPKYNYYFSYGNYWQNADVYKMCSDMVKKGIKSYVSVKPDNQVGQVMDPAISAAWKQASPTIDKKAVVFVPTSTVDWGPIATKIKSYNADCVDLIYLGFIEGSVPNIYRALSDVGYRGIILPGLMSQPVLDALVTTVGKAAVEGGECASADPYTWQTGDQKALMDSYVKEYGKWEQDGSPRIFQMLQSIINATQSVDPDVIKNYMDNSPAPMPTNQGTQMWVARPDLGQNFTVSGISSGRLGLIVDGKLIGGALTTNKDHYLYTIKQYNTLDAWKAWWAEYGYPNFPADEKGLETFKYSDLGITGQD